MRGSRPSLRLGRLGASGGAAFGLRSPRSGHAVGHGNNQPTRGTAA